MAKRLKDEFDSKWILRNSLEIIPQFEDGVLTIRGLHYKLVGRGMTNSMLHYKRVVTTMIRARRDSLVSYFAFSDHDRAVDGITEYDKTNVNDSIEQYSGYIRYYMNNYNKNRWENQDYYPEIWIEKKAQLGVFKPICEKFDVALAACKGYPSLTFLNDAATRFQNAADEGYEPIILYFGDYDPSGEDIPRSIKDNLYKDFHVNIEMKRILLLEHQVIEYNLPPAPTKIGDSRTAGWDGLGQVEMDAIDPKETQSLCTDAIKSIMDQDKYDELLLTEVTEEKEYISRMKKIVNEL